MKKVNEGHNASTNQGIGWHILRARSNHCRY